MARLALSTRPWPYPRSPALRGFGFATVPELLSGKVLSTAFPPPPPEPSTAPPVDPESGLLSLMSLVTAHGYASWPI